MSMSTDVKAKHLSATGVVYPARTRVRGMVLCAVASQTGKLILKDGGSGGTVLFEVDIPSNSNPNSFNVLVPSGGILFSSSVYAELTNLASVTTFYG